MIQAHGGGVVASCKAIHPDNFSQECIQDYGALVTDVNDSDDLGASIQPCIDRARLFLEAGKPVFFLTGNKENKSELEREFAKFFETGQASFNLR